MSDGGDEDSSVFVISDSMYEPKAEPAASASSSVSLASVSIDGDYGLKQLQPEIDVAGSNGQAMVSADYALTSQDTADGVHAGSNGAVEEQQTLEGVKL